MITSNTHPFHGPCDRCGEAVTQETHSILIGQDPDLDHFGRIILCPVCKVAVDAILGEPEFVEPTPFAVTVELSGCDGCGIHLEWSTAFAFKYYTARQPKERFRFVCEQCKNAVETLLASTDVVING